MRQLGGHCQRGRFGCGALLQRGDGLVVDADAGNQAVAEVPRLFDPGQGQHPGEKLQLLRHQPPQLRQLLQGKNRLGEDPFRARFGLALKPLARRRRIAAGGERAGADKGQRLRQLLVVDEFPPAQPLQKAQELG